MLTYEMQYDIVKRKRRKDYMLEGFKQYNMTIGTASVSITENGIAFSKTTIIKMDKVPYVKLLIDEEGKRIAIQKALENDEGAIGFYNNQKIVSVRWNNKELLKTVAKMMNWELSGNVYRVDGDYVAEEEAMIFDLKEAEKSSSK